MDFSLTEEQNLMSDSVERFAKNKIAPGVEEREEKGNSRRRYGGSLQNSV